MTGGSVCLGMGEDVQQIRPSAGHPGTDGPGGAVADLSCLLIGQTQHLGYHEGGSPLGL